MSFRLLLPAILYLTLVCCQSDVPSAEQPVEVSTPAQPDTRPASVQAMESVLGMDAYSNFAGVRYDLNLKFRGTTRFEGTILQTGSMDRIYLKQENETMVFDGEQVHVSTTGTLNTRSARFNALTWPYFFSLPFKLGDPGTQLESLDDQTVNGVTYQRAKLTFSAGTGDAPDDWYILYFDGQKRLAAAAYIVTFGGKSPAEALANAHAICYHDYETIDGVEVAQNWTFHDWSEAEGWTTQIGEGALSKVSMLSEIPVDQFAIPEGAIAAGAPQG